MKPLFAGLLALFLAAQAHGQCAGCGEGRCFVPTALPKAATGPIKFDWRQREDDPGRWYLFADDRLIGGYDIQGEYYRPYDEAADKWGPRQPCGETRERLTGLQADDAEPGEIKKKPHFGVDTSKLKGESSYRVHSGAGARNVSREEAHKIVSQKLEDDSNKLRITVIGDDGQQKQVISDIQSVLKDIGTWAVVRGYPKGHWALEPGFVQAGNPTIYCQAPSGKVLHRQDDYDGGVEATVDALRKARSGYDPKKDPDLRKAAVNPSGNNQLLSYGIAAAAGAGIVYLTKRRTYVR